MREARRDYEKIKGREQEESRMSLRELDDIRCDAAEMISDARESYQGQRQLDQCNRRNR